MGMRVPRFSNECAVIDSAHAAQVCTRYRGEVLRICKLRVHLGARVNSFRMFKTIDARPPSPVRFEESSQASNPRVDPLYIARVAPAHESFAFGPERASRRETEPRLAYQCFA